MRMTGSAVISVNVAGNKEAAVVVTWARVSNRVAEKTEVIAPSLTRNLAMRTSTRVCEGGEESSLLTYQGIRELGHSYLGTKQFGDSVPTYTSI